MRMPREMIPLEPVDEVRLTIVTDNVVDVTLGSTDTARRFRMPTDVRLDTPLPIAEHGFSALLDVRRGDQRSQVLFDTGVSPRGFLYNLDALQIDPLDMQAIVISHGHFDHTMGLLGLSSRFGHSKVPMVVHPDAYLERKTISPNGEERHLPTPLRADFRRDNIEVIEEVGPSTLVEGMVLISGEVERTSGFEPGLPMQWALREGQWQHDPLVRDDQCAIVNVRDKGLVIVTGCGHAGVINIVRHAQALTGVTAIHAVVGGFHLSGPVFEKIIGPTVAALHEIGPRYLLPGHCTGFPAAAQLANAMPLAYIPNSVGTTYVL
jgi:7,8-dihydropterin-6-yl-methyl-4-(beta-D-ribofuranosyl)aminobenzene 5'-phosphate synthase